MFARVKSLLKLKEFTDELETAESVLCTLGLSVESRDPYTEGHCERLAKNASNLGRHLGLDEESIVALRRGGYLHDLGKIAVPDEILKKGTNLTPDRVGRHEAASHDRGEHLPAAKVAAPGAARLSATITSIPMAAAIRTDCEVMKFRCCRGFCRWWTCTMPCGLRGLTSWR